jgi:hypothetical protein
VNEFRVQFMILNFKNKNGLLCLQFLHKGIIFLDSKIFFFSHKTEIIYPSKILFF